MTPSRQSDLPNPFSALDHLPRFRRFLMGFAALVSGVFAGLLGSLIFYWLFTNPARLGPRSWIATTYGVGLLSVAFFMILIWARFWFGPREWLERAIIRIFLRSFVYLLLAVCSLFVVVAIVLIKG